MKLNPCKMEPLRAARFAVLCGVMQFFPLVGALQAQPGKILDINAFENFGGLDTVSDPVTVSASLQPVGSPGKSLLAVTARIEPSWHIYSITQPSGGPFPSEIVLQDVAAPAISAWKTSPPPAVHIDQEAWKGLSLEEHSGKVTWTVEVELPTGKNRIEGYVTVQACTSGENGIGGQCLPPKQYDFTAELASASSAIAPTTVTPQDPPSPANRQTAPNQTPVLPDVSGLPGNSDLPGNKGITDPKRSETKKPHSAAEYQDKEVQWSVVVRPDRTDDTVYLVDFVPKLSAGWHIYQLEEVEDPKKLGYKPTLLAIEQAENAQVGKPAASTVAEKKDVLGDGSFVVPIYEMAPTVTLPVRVESIQKAARIRGVLGYQTCNDVECLAAAGMSFELAIEPSKRNAVISLQQAKYGVASSLAKSRPVPWSKASFGSMQAPMDVAILARYLGLAFAAGFLLNFMPCVLPVVGLKVLAFVKQAKDHPVEALITNFIYVLGILVVFWGIAGVILWAGFGWGAQFQSATFLITMLALVWASALSLLGVWDMPVLGFATSARANQLAAQKGYVGSFFKGVFTTLLATPCTGPLLIPAMTWALAQPVPVVFGVFSMIGLGMGSPFLLVGLFPRLASLLPKPGDWMDTFKQVMGFVMLGFAAWLFSLIAKEHGAAVFVFLIGIWGACWVLGRIPAGAEFDQTLRGWGAAAAVAAATGVFAFNNVQWFELPWQEFSEAKLTSLLEQRKTVLIDFTADWCLNCHAMKAWVLDTYSTSEALKQADAVPLIADLSKSNPEAESLLDQLGNKAHGIPFVAIIPGADPSKAITLSGGALTKAKMAAALQQAKSYSPNLAAMEDAPLAPNSGLK